MEHIRVNNSRENEELKQENKRLQNEKNGLKTQVDKSFYEAIWHPGYEGSGEDLVVIFLKKFGLKPRQFNFC